MKKFAIAVTIFAAGYFAAGWTEPNYRCDDVKHVVQPGDSLWSIADTHCAGEVTVVVDKLAESYGTDIDVGEEIELP